MTHGLRLEGINVAVGIDLDPVCEYPFEHNNDSEFLCADVAELTGDSLRDYYPTQAVKLLAGCAPCQPFSTYSQGHRNDADDRWTLLRHFARLIKELRPELVTMENVPKLRDHEVFADFVQTLKNLEYNVTHQVVDCREYGIPQNRKRLVLLASQLGEVELQKPTHAKKDFITVRQVIGCLEKLAAGGVSKRDPLHRASALSEKNMERIRASKPDGTWRDWDKELVADCHNQKSGKTYPSVYGRMSWDKPAPTMTTQCYGFGNGRFGHPEQDRAISLREAALFQTFPPDYAFAEPNGPISFKKTGRLIGNAVPVKLARVIAQSILMHLEKVSA